MADNDNAVLNSGAQGATAGATVGGPWGAVVGGAGGVLAGLLNGSRNQPTPDLAKLFGTIAASGQNERALINSLPVNLRPLYDQYKASLGAAGTNLQATNANIGQTLEAKTAGLYGPENPAVQATLSALRQQDYSTLPDTLNNLKAQLAATGGLQRGGAETALTKAVLAPAAQYSQQAANITGQQLTTQQTAVQSAINKVAALDEATAQAMFGMSKEQAAQILQYGRDDLKQQLSQLINQSRTESGQNLALEGIGANAAYENSVAQNANQAGIVNGLINTGVNAGGGIVNALANTSSTGVPAGADVGSNDYMRNALANAPE
jgi:signal transduction histidine kinase